MNVYMIKASAPGPFKDYKKAMGAPPQNIFALAAATPDGIGITLCDETIGMSPKLNIEADLVVLLFHTPDAVHAYDLADKFKARGKSIILGGLHTSFMPEEALDHADALVMGEAEGIWEELLKDFQAGCLKKTYQRDTLVDLAKVNPYPTDLIPPSKYSHFWSVLVSRGCVHHCDFCTVPPFFEGKYRKRPIENIVREIQAAPATWFELHADNLTADRAYAMDLFKALVPLKINWMGEATIKMADDEALLAAAAQSGCRGLLIGIETPSQAALKESGKGFVDPEIIREKISRFHAHGIKITSSMIFGFDTHTPEIFRESETFCRYVGIDEVESVILIPFPGTPLYQRLSSENRLLTHDWSKYDGANAVFTPAHMTQKQLEQGSTKFWQEIRKKKPRPKNLSLEYTSGDTQKNSPPGGGRGVRVSGPSLTTNSIPVRWKSLLALGLIGAGLYFQWYWIWGALLVIWAIMDLRSRHTYLLDDIPRSDSPILYWIVVLMWLVMGIWALSTSPALSQVIAPPAFLKQETPETRIASGSIKEDKKPGYEVRFTGPKRWTQSEERTGESLVRQYQSQDNRGHITLVAIDFQAQIPLDSLISYMEKTMEPELPFVSSTTRTAQLDSSDAISIHGDGTQMVFREYAGILKKTAVLARAGYAVHHSLGYAIIGVYGQNDQDMERQIKAILNTFSLKQ